MKIVGQKSGRRLVYDVIIAGGSFGGLAVARELEGRILLIDKAEIGVNQTSACVTLVDTLQKLGCEDSILQTFDPIFINVLGKDIAFEFGYSFCTFDYQKFCQIMLKSIEAEIINAKVKGVKGNSVITDKGEFEGRILVDATGWRAVLANSLRVKNNRNDFASKRRLSFGFETVIEHSDDKLKFYWNPNALRKGVTWVFPVGEETRFGIASYVGETKLHRKLEGFLDGYKLGINSLHGGYFPHKLRQPVTGSIFLVGDSAGHCLPLTGEGIRPALYFGQRCGRVIQKIIDKEITLEEGLAEYRSFALKHAFEYVLFFRLQKFFTNIPDFLTLLILEYLKREKIFSPLASRYRKVAVLKELKEKRDCKNGFP